MRHRRSDQVGAGRQGLATLDEAGAKPDQGFGKGGTSVAARPAGTDQPIESGTQPAHPVRKKRDPRHMAEGSGTSKMPGNQRQPQQGQRHLQGRHPHQSSFQPEWIQAMPADMRRTRTCAKPAPANISARTSGGGKVRIDSTR